MELDDLKNKWQNNHSTNTSTSKQTIMELSQQKSYGPVAALKNVLTKQMVLIPFLVIVLIIQAVRNPSLQSDPFFGLFTGMILLAALFFTISYLILTKMDKQAAPVAHRLKNDIRSLNNMLWCYRLTFLVAIILLPIFVEVFKDMGTMQLMQAWYDIHPVLRIGSYVSLLITSFYFSRTLFNKDFGKHLADLKKNLSAIE